MLSSGLSNPAKGEQQRGDRYEYHNEVAVGGEPDRRRGRGRAERRFRSGILLWHAGLWSEHRIALLWRLLR
jgi:hypothetical protein